MNSRHTQHLKTEIPQPKLDSMDNSKIADNPVQQPEDCKQNPEASPQRIETIISDYEVRKKGYTNDQLFAWLTNKFGEGKFEGVMRHNQYYILASEKFNLARYHHHYQPN